LQRRSQQGEPKFDLLFMDAFASDSIPIHLITQECFDVYCQNLSDDGILIAHISNRFVDLRPVVYQAALDHGLTPILVDYESKDKTMKTRWVLMTKNQQIIESGIVAKNQDDWPTDMKPVRWTDDYTSLAALLDWSGGIDWKMLNQINEMRQQRK
jgi:spermidine synthase